MKKLLLLAMIINVKVISAQTFQQISTSNGDVFYRYTSTCGIATNITSIGGEFTLTEALIAANIANTRLCGTRVSSIQFKSTSLE